MGGIAAEPKGFRLEKCAIAIGKLAESSDSNNNSEGILKKKKKTRSINGSVMALIIFDNNMPPHGHGDEEEEEVAVVTPRLDGPPFVDIHAEPGKGFEVDHDAVQSALGPSKARTSPSLSCAQRACVESVDAWSDCLRISIAGLHSLAVAFNPCALLVMRADFPGGLYERYDSNQQRLRPHDTKKLPLSAHRLRRVRALFCACRGALKAKRGTHLCHIALSSLAVVVSLP